MNWNRIIRQVHRWVSIAFVAGVIFYVIAMQRGRPPGWFGVFPLVPLILLLVTGLYLFVLPYALKSRAPRRPA